MNTRATIQSVVDLDLGRGVRARDVAGDLLFEYVSVGVSSELQEQLRKRLGPVRSWLFAAEELGNWRECAEFVRLGDELLEELRIESAAARVGCSPEEFCMVMKLESSDPLLRAVAKVWVERRWPAGRGASTPQCDAAASGIAHLARSRCPLPLNQPSLWSRRPEVPATPRTSETAVRCSLTRRRPGIRAMLPGYPTCLSCQLGPRFCPRCPCNGCLSPLLNQATQREVT
ncbi:hypothetical protein DIPPA_57552, partial [Diplonema papillatum]